MLSFYLQDLPTRPEVLNGTDSFSFEDYLLPGMAGKYLGRVVAGELAGLAGMEVDGEVMASVSPLAFKPVSALAFGSFLTWNEVLEEEDNGQRLEVLSALEQLALGDSLILRQTTRDLRSHMNINLIAEHARQHADFRRPLIVSAGQSLARFIFPFIEDQVRGYDWSFLSG